MIPLADAMLNAAILLPLILSILSFVRVVPWDFSFRPAFTSRKIPPNFYLKFGVHTATVGRNEVLRSVRGF